MSLKLALARYGSWIMGEKDALASGETAEYWTEHNVTLHHGFSSVTESLEYFHWRNAQYFGYIDLMPVTGYDGKAVLDFGCGPGHDLVGFGVYSRPQRLVGLDLSEKSLSEASRRLELHGINAELTLLMPAATDLPFSDASFDHIHTSGVLHHTPDPVHILKEMRRILRPGGTVNIMVYNRDSVWMHLYVAYIRTVIEGLYPGANPDEQFEHSTDGEDCPISNCYRPQDWVELCEIAGLKASYSGAAISMHEASLLPQRFAAIQNRTLASESRDFLLELTFDKYGYPLYRGNYAGVDACFRAVAL